MATKALQNGELRWTRNVGRNGFDAPGDILPDQSCESVNLLLQGNALAKKRHGSVLQTFTGTYTGYAALGRYVPPQDEPAAQLHFFDFSTPPKLLRVPTPGTAAIPLTLVDAVAARPQDAVWANLNGKMYWAYDSGVNRLHVYDPSIAPVDVLRRVGLAPPGVPTVANQGAGTYPATLRYYRIAWQTYGYDLRRQSNLGPKVAFTPSGTGLAARITKPAASGTEYESHWAVYGSINDTVYYELKVLETTTTFYDDIENPIDYDTHPASAEVGAFTPWPSVKYILSTGERLVGFGVYELIENTGDAMPPKNGRVYFSPVLDTTDADDDERVSNSLTTQGWIDVARDAGGEDIALGGPLDGNVFVFQSKGIYMLVYTGDNLAPFRRVTLSPIRGAVSQHSTFMGEDETGRPCIYWLDPEQGPYRYGANGMQWCGYDVADLWATLRRQATIKVAHGVYDSTLRACLWWIATTTADAEAPNLILAFFVREGQSTAVDGVRNGWAQWDNVAAHAVCSVMFASTIGNPMSRRLSPYAGIWSPTAKLLRVNDPAAVDDDGAPFQGLVISRAWDIAPVHANKRLGRSYLIAQAATNAVIRQALMQDYAGLVRWAAVDLTAITGESRVLRKFEEADLMNWFTFQVWLGDEGYLYTPWTIDEWIATVEATADER